MRYIAALIERLLIKCEGVHDLLDLDGNIYTTVIIGSQEWIAENLRVTQYADRTVIPYLTLNGDWIADVTGAYCWYNNDIGYKTPYGALYNWYAVDNAHGLAYLERGGVMETGWRVATLTDYGDLITSLGGGALAGGKLKESGIIHWDPPNTGADNSSGFTALPGGWRDNVGSFDWITEIGTLWTATESPPGSAYDETMSYLSADISSDPVLKLYGKTVRLVRDI